MLFNHFYQQQLFKKNCNFLLIHYSKIFNIYNAVQYVPMIRKTALKSPKNCIIIHHLRLIDSKQ